MKKYRCMNIGNCNIAGTKETFEIAEGDDKVCPKCGSTLVAEVSEKKPLPWIIGGVVALCVLGGIGYAVFGGHAGNNELELEPEALPTCSDSTFVDSLKSETEVIIYHQHRREDCVVDTLQIDTVKIEQEVIPEVKQEKAVSTTPAPAKSSASQAGNGKLKLSYGQYTGEIRNGYPHGQGRLTYTTTRQINRNDMKARKANAGDYVIGEFFNGFVMYGKHYDSEGNLLGTLNFGVGSEDSYESK